MCSSCGRSFSSRNRMFQHIRQHCDGKNAKPSENETKMISRVKAVKVALLIGVIGEPVANQLSPSKSSLTLNELFLWRALDAVAATSPDCTASGTHPSATSLDSNSGTLLTAKQKVLDRPSGANFSSCNRNVQQLQMSGTMHIGCDVLSFTTDPLKSRLDPPSSHSADAAAWCNEACRELSHNTRTFILLMLTLSFIIRRFPGQ